MDPLSPEEVNALELDSSLESSVKYKQRYIDTIHELQRKLIEEHDWFCQAQRERDELQRKLDAYQKLAAPVWPNSSNIR